MPDRVRLMSSTKELTRFFSELDIVSKSGIGKGKERPD